MRRLLSFFLVLLTLWQCAAGSLPLEKQLPFFAQPRPASSGPWVFLRSASAASADANAVTNTINTTGASALFLAIGTAGHSPTPTNTSGGTWTQLVEATDASSSWVSLWKAPVTVTNANEKIWVAGSFIYPTMNVFAFSGGAGGFLDQTNGATGNGSSLNINAGVLVPIVDNELIFAGYISHTAPTSLSINYGFSTPVTNMSATAVPTAGAYLIQTSAGSVSPTWVKNANDFMATVTASIK